MVIVMFCERQPITSCISLELLSFFIDNHGVVRRGGHVLFPIRRCPWLDGLRPATFLFSLNCSLVWVDGRCCMLLVLWNVSKFFHSSTDVFCTSVNVWCMGNHWGMHLWC